MFGGRLFFASLKYALLCKKTEHTNENQLLQKGFWILNPSPVQWQNKVDTIELPAVFDVSF